jgi:site-specific recombinase XerD
VDSAYTGGTVVAHPTDAAPDPRGRLVVSLLAEERLTYPEIAALTDRDVDLAAGRWRRPVNGSQWHPLSEHTAAAVRAYRAVRDPAPGPLVRHQRRNAPLTARWLEDLVHAWHTGLDRRRRPEGAEPLYELIRQYVHERKTAGQLAATSVPNTLSILVRFADTVAGVEPALITRRDVERWVGRAGLAPSTRRRELSTLRTFWRWLVVTERATGDPTLGVVRVREPRRLPRGLRADQVAAALAAAPDARARLIVTLMVQLGLRAVEVSRLRVEDLDAWERTVRVVGKGGHERVLPLVDEAAGAVRDYLAEWPATRGPLVRSYNDPTKALCATYIAKSVADWMHTAGIAETGHSLRHTMASDLLKRGIDVKTVSASLGHANVATTSRYLPLVVTPLREAMEGRRYGQVEAEEAAR